MRILDVRVGTANEANDIALGRTTLQAEISHPAKTIMVIRGSGAEISLFADRASGRTSAFPWREVVWVKNNKIFNVGQENMLFPGNYTEHCAVILDLADQPAVWLKVDSSVPDIEDAFLEAGRRR
jgi:hypothetical protein